MRYDRPEEVTELEFVISKALYLIEEEKMKEAKELLTEKNNRINKSYE